MKKLVFFALILSVCTGMVFSQQQWRVTNREGGGPAANNTVTIQRGSADQYIYIYFDEGVPGAEFDRIRIDFTVDNPISLYWMCAYAPNQVWGAHRGGTNRTTWNYTGLTSGYIETDMAHLTHLWHDGTRAPFSKAEITGVCLAVNASARTTFTVTNVTFVGLR